MPNLLSPVDHVKRRLSSTVLTPAPRALDDPWRRWSRDWSASELAPLPSGGPLKPVLGDPFGGGAHKCTGMQFGTLEVKAILHRMLRTFRWTLPANYHARWVNTSLPVSAGGLLLELRRR
jgi:hypothetical protein